MFNASGNYERTYELDTDEGTAEVLVMHHILNPDGRAAPPRFQWMWFAADVWPKGETGAPGIVEWVGRDDAWLVEGERYPTQRDATAAALRVARSRMVQS